MFQLDLETPTTAEVPFESQYANDPLSTNADRDEETLRKGKCKTFLTEDGFNFSTLVVDEEESGELSDLQSKSNDSSPNKSNDNRSVWHSQDELNKNDDFDPFGINHIKSLSADVKVDSSKFYYTHPADIMKEVVMKPYSNIFRPGEEIDEEDVKITCDNIATLTACLQRSVMLPLTYQLEVVNNSILTYFLVNLDMYEHLRSLKDYFFLMDGEFSKSICHNLFDKLEKTINPQELLNFATLHNILDKALGSSISRKLALINFIFIH